MRPNIDYTKRCTPEEFLKAELDMGISIANEEFVKLCKFTAEQIGDLRIKSVLDYGAGTGVYAEAYRKLGYDVYVYEIWDEHKRYIKDNLPQVKIAYEPITTDLMNFIEVAEHMTSGEIMMLFNKIHPSYILFSSTSEKTEWDEAWGHINIQTQEQWILFFDYLGYEYIKPLNYPTNYTKLFKRK